MASSDEAEDPDEYLDDEVPGALVPDEDLYKEKKEDWRVAGEWMWLWLLKYHQVIKLFINIYENLMRDYYLLILIISSINSTLIFILTFLCIVHQYFYYILKVNINSLKQ